MGTKNKSAGTQFTPRGVVQGINVVAHESGLPVDSIVDGSGVRRLAVDSNINIDSATINVDLDAADDNVAIRNTANTNELFMYPDGTIATRIVDESGAAFSGVNPLPVEISAGNLDIEVSALDGDTIATSGHVTQIFSENSVNVTTNASFTTIMAFTGTISNSNIIFAELTAGVDGCARITINGTEIRRRNLTQGNPTVDFYFYEPRRFGIGDVIRVEFQPRDSIPAFLTAVNVFASLQGFVDS